MQISQPCLWMSSEILPATSQRFLSQPPSSQVCLSWKCSANLWFSIHQGMSSNLGDLPTPTPAISQAAGNFSVRFIQTVTGVQFQPPASEGSIFPSELFLMPKTFEEDFKAWSWGKCRQAQKNGFRWMASYAPTLKMRTLSFREVECFAQGCSEFKCRSTWDLMSGVQLRKTSLV